MQYYESEKYNNHPELKICPKSYTFWIGIHLPVLFPHTPSPCLHLRGNHDFEVCIYHSLYLVYSTHK